MHVGSLEDVADMLSVTKKTVGELVQVGTVVKLAPGQYDLAATAKNYIASLRKQADAPSLTAARVRLTELKAQHQELELRRDAGELAPIEQFSKLQAQTFTTVRTLMLAIPAQLAPRIVMVRSAVEAQALMRKEIEKVLEQATITPIAVDPSSGRNASRSRRDAAAKPGDPEAAADADDFAMG